MPNRLIIATLFAASLSCFACAHEPTVILLRPSAKSIKVTVDGKPGVKVRSAIKAELKDKAVISATAKNVTAAKPLKLKPLFAQTKAADRVRWDLEIDGHTVQIWWWDQSLIDTTDAPSPGPGPGGLRAATPGASTASGATPTPQGTITGGNTTPSKTPPPVMPMFCVVVSKGSLSPSFAGCSSVDQ